MNPQISVLITSYNSNDLLISALDSALSQTIPPKEILIVDDGSKIPTTELLINYDQNVKVIRQMNSGQGSATNTAIRYSKHDLIAILDHDDYWPSNKLEWQSKLLLETGADIVVGSVINEWKYPNGESESKFMGIARVFGSCLIHRKAFDKVGFLDERTGIHEVIEWWSKANNKIKVVTDPRLALFRRIHGKNMTLKSEHSDHKELLSRLRAHISTKEMKNGSTP